MSLAADCQLVARADVRFLSVSVCCSAAARSAAGIAGLVWKLGYSAIGVGRPAAACRIVDVYMEGPCIYVRLLSEHLELVCEIIQLKTAVRYDGV
jgi:hypothetical protein